VHRYLCIVLCLASIGNLNAKKKMDPIYTTTKVSKLLEMGRAYKDKEQFKKAINCFERIRALEPGHVIGTFECALTYTLIGQTQKAIALYEEILKKHPHQISALQNIGFAYKMQDEPEKAIPYYQKILTLDPENDNAHFALGRSYLKMGDYARGWKQHARFLKKMDRNGDTLRRFLAEGTAEGKTILLKPEGGLGDVLHFIRYARELKRYGMNVIALVQKPLYQLLSNCEYIDHLVPLGQGVPAFDDHTTMMSVPGILYDHEQRMPTFAPYITPDETLVAYWQEQLRNDTRFRIGLCWQASAANDVSRPPAARRGIPLSELFILGELDNVHLYSLQQKDGLKQIKRLPSYFRLHTFDDDFDKSHGSFMDTAAVIQQLDLVITVDTAIAHLAGAMGKRVWLLLPWSTDWRWIAKKTTSDWYPTMRIFQQPKPFDWQSVVEEVFVSLLLELEKGV